MYTEKNDVSMVYHTVKGVSHWAILRLLSGYIIIPKSSKSKFQWLRTAMNISFSLWLRSHGNNLLVCHFLDRMRIPLTRCMLILIHVYKYIIVYITLPWLGYCIYIYITYVKITSRGYTWSHFLFWTTYQLSRRGCGSSISTAKVSSRPMMDLLSIDGWYLDQGTSNSCGVCNKKKSGEQWKTTISVTTDT